MIELIFYILGVIYFTKEIVYAIIGLYLINKAWRVNKVLKQELGDAYKEAAEDEREITINVVNHTTQ